MIDPSQMQGGAPGGAPGGGMPMIGPESLLALIAGAMLGQMSGGQPGQAQAAQPQGQAKGEGSAVGQSSMQSILPQMLAAFSGSPGPSSAGKGVGGSQAPTAPRNPQAAQEPVALSVLRMLGMTRPPGAA